MVSTLCCSHANGREPAIFHAHVPPEQASRRRAIDHRQKSQRDSQRRFTLAFDMRGAVAKKTKPWFVNSPGEADNRVTWDAQRGCLLFEAQHSEIAAAQGFHPAPSRVEQKRMLHFDMELGPREQKELNFVLAIAENGRAAIELYDQPASASSPISRRKTRQLYEPGSIRIHAGQFRVQRQSAAADHK